MLELVELRLLRQRVEAVLRPGCRDSRRFTAYICAFVGEDHGV